MTTKVKICGLKTPETLAAALDAGAEYVGLVFYPPSPRNIAPSVASDLSAMAKKRSKVVALFVDPDDAFLDAVLRSVNPDIIQLHGSETPDRIAEIRTRTDADIMKAVKVATAADVTSSARYTNAVDMILFDAKSPPGATHTGNSSLPGGNGEAFDWTLLQRHDTSHPWMLSGGLNADNVAAAIRQTGAPAVDVSSGVEQTRGVKNIKLIAAFVAAVKSVTLEATHPEGANLAHDGPKGQEHGSAASDDKGGHSRVNA